ncbi:pancreatic triacylglycerol lipase-like [Lasioglossum baleicum]|uniref:pancreatic triacylglycerol lipase-like n=1 Tax=Lasioglossum baleicum TaxID=434251 RepID=UPI003FCD525C
MSSYALLGLLLIHSISGLGLRGADLDALLENEKDHLDPGNKLMSHQIQEGTPNETLEETEHDLLNRVHFNLYTKANPTDGQRLNVDDIDALQKSNFNFSKPTIFITHGWLNTVYNDPVTLIRDAYLQHGDYNVIGIDWTKISFKPYIWASDRVLLVSKYSSSFVNFLKKQGLNLSRVTIIGHCLGGHVAGLTARHADGQVDYVVALDPALPNFALSEPGERVAQGDAKYVQVIHTNTGVLGYERAIGDIDFYPNGGAIQPGCTSNTCSHLRAYKYFAESINSKSGFEAVRCDVYSKFSRGACNSNAKTALGGAIPNYEAKGVYFLTSKGESPFAKGAVSVEL